MSRFPILRRRNQSGGSEIDDDPWGGYDTLEGHGWRKGSIVLKKTAENYSDSKKMFEC